MAKFPCIVSNKKGSITLLFALLLPLLVGLIGTGVEVNAWYRQKSDLQKAADASAIATTKALDPSACGQSFNPQAQSCLLSVAKASVSANGFGPRAGGQQLFGGVTVVTQYASHNDEVQVCVSLTESRLFSAISESNGTVTLNTCAVAKYSVPTVGNLPVGIYVNDSSTYSFLGAGSITATDAAVI